MNAKKKPFTKREDPAETGEFGRPAPAKRKKKPVAKKRPMGTTKKKGC